jgi:5-methylcytosine-specific restriction endonuclease McrA
MDPAAKKQRAVAAYLRDRAVLLSTYRGGCGRAREVGALVTLTHDEWRAINAETACHWCGLALHESFRNIDHIVPLVEGGEQSKGNLVSACANCNMRREWERKMKYPRVKEA